MKRPRITPTVQASRERVLEVVREHNGRLAKIDDDLAHTVNAARADAAARRVKERARYLKELADARDGEGKEAA